MAMNYHPVVCFGLVLRDFGGSHDGNLSLGLPLGFELLAVWRLIGCHNDSELAWGADTLLETLE